MRTRSLIFLLVMLAVHTGSAQYFNEQVMEKSFERSDFFFRPNYLNPYGIGGFGEAALGLIDEPLVNLELNPAALVSDTSWDRHYIYVDFRNSRDIVKESLGSERTIANAPQSYKTYFKVPKVLDDNSGA